MAPSTPPAKGKTTPAPESTHVHDTARAGDGKHYALRHTLGGAPNTLHVIPGVGYVQHDPPAPVGGPGEPTLEQAVRASRDQGCAVELVEVDDKQAGAAREHMGAARASANRALAQALRADQELPQDRIDDEKAALTGRKD